MTTFCVFLCVSGLLRERWACGVRGREDLRDAADAGVAAVREHFALFFAVEEVVVVLHADELVPVVLGGDVLEGLEFPRGHLQSTLAIHCRA